MRSNKTLEEEFRKEITKWTNKLDKALPKAAPSSDHGEKLLKNIRAYCEDSKYFLERNDLIRSFECLIWAWALLELGKELKCLS